MSKSFTSYHGFGFWSKDWLLECWLRLLALNLGRVDDSVYASGWLHDVRDEWLLKSTGFFSGWLDANLDLHITDEQRKAVIIQSAKITLAKVKDCGDQLPGSLLCVIGLNWGNEGRVLSEDICSIATRFIDLLEGRLTTTPGTSPVLPMPWVLDTEQTG